MAFSSTEMYVIIIAGSLPTLRPLVQKTLSSYRSYKQRSSRGYHSSGEAPYMLNKLPGRNTIGSKPKRNQDMGSDQDVVGLAPGVAAGGGITKTTDFTLEEEGGGEGGTMGKKEERERWEDDGFTQRKVRADERV